MKKLMAWLLTVSLVFGCSFALSEDAEWTCLSCGAVNTTKYCTQCGEKKPDDIVCPGCGKVYSFDTTAIFCGDCGTKLAAEEEEPDAAVNNPVEEDAFDLDPDTEIVYGMYIECLCTRPEGLDDDSYSALVNTAMGVIKDRLKGAGIEKAVIKRVDSDAIWVGLPDVQDETLPDLICAPGKLEFRDPEGNAFMTNEMVKTADYYYSEGDHQVAFTLTDEGAKTFADVTAANIGKAIAIYIDGEQLIAPTVQSAILNGSGVINGLGSSARAVSVAAKIQAPPLPLELALGKAEMITDAVHAEEKAAREKAELEDGLKIILKLGDKEITKKEVKDQIAYELNYYASLYSMFGYSYDTTDPANIASAREEAINSLKEDMALTRKAAELGLDQLTEEEMASVKEKAQSSYDSAVDYVKDYVLTDEQKEGRTDEEITRIIEETLGKMEVTLDTYIESETKKAVDEKLREYAIRDVAVTDDEIQAEYDSKVEADKESYAESAGSWATAANYGTTLYYTPAGVRRVKQILTKFRDEDQAAIDEAKQKVTDATTARNAVQAKIDSANEKLNLEGDTDEIKEAKEAAQADLEAAQKELEEADKALAEASQAVTDATEKAFANLDEEVDAILASLDAEGADWQAIMDEKNQDPGMKSNEKGYAVAADMTNFDSAFVEAAMALEKPGDHSGKVRGLNYGYYIIRYESDEAEGPVALDEVKEQISSGLLSTRQNEAYTAAKAQWVEEAGIEEYLDLLDD